ncbi:magnesium chelatase domain-containing protein [Nocardia elegans]|uniref:magnesium chelatase domain-containing protein n=1 Tax=Nocardia elegans TaxID=300029 RepID=UPI002B4B809E|nr:magnesium chelatase domain-containing protein [Nocardia elegans]
MTILLQVLEQSFTPTTPWERRKFTFVDAGKIVGMRLDEPAADLAIALAIASAECDTALPAGWVILGEVGLAGEVRKVTGVARRLAEAERLGFTTALVPPGSERLKGATIRVHEVGDVRSALRISGLRGRKSGGD